MPWLSIFSGALKLVNWLAGQLERRQLIDQGRREEVGNANAKALDAVRIAVAARRATPKYLSGGVRDADDPDFRD